MDRSEWWFNIFLIVVLFVIFAIDTEDVLVKIIATAVLVLVFVVYLYSDWKNDQTK